MIQKIVIIIKQNNLNQIEDKEKLESMLVNIFL